MACDECMALRVQVGAVVGYVMGSDPPDILIRRKLPALRVKQGQQEFYRETLLLYNK